MEPAAVTAACSELEPQQPQKGCWKTNLNDEGDNTNPLSVGGNVKIL